MSTNKKKKLFTFSVTHTICKNPFSSLLNIWKSLFYLKDPCLLARSLPLRRFCRPVAALKGTRAPQGTFLMMLNCD